MELIILLLVGAGMWWFIRRVDKSPKRSIPVTRPPNVSKLGTYRPSLRPVNSVPPAQQNSADDVLPSFVLGAVTGLPIATNLTAGVVGAALHEPNAADAADSHRSGDRHTQDSDASHSRQSDEGSVQSSDDVGGTSSGGDSGSND